MQDKSLIPKVYVQRATNIISLAMIAVFMIYSQTFFAPRETIFALFLGFSLIIIFLKELEKSKSKYKSVLLLIFMVVTVFCTYHICLNWEAIIMRRWFNPPIDLFVGCALLIFVFYASLLSFSRLVVYFILLAVIYPFFGQHLPEPFTTLAYSLNKTIANLSIGLNTGIFGDPLRVAINYVFLFVVFGGLLGVTGVRNFFFEFGKLLVGKLRSGAALVSVVNSALIGMVVGSSIANVSVTGLYTIPAMKKAGYNPEQAAAIEAAASNGGQILPPVMGVVAFAMAGYTGIPYLEICKMGLIPAILYFLIVGIYAHLHAYKNDKIKKFTEQNIDWTVLRYKAPCFVIPLGVIISLLIKGYTISFVGFWAIVSTLVISQIAPKAYRPKLKDYIQGLVEGAVSGAKIGIISALIGTLVISFSGSGLGVKLTAGIETWSGGSLFLAMLILWASSIILGMVGVSLVAYFTAAAFAVPVLVNLGVPFDVAHFFIVWPSVFSTITPPVAVVSVVAANIAEADYIKASLEACKAAAVAFILPFLFIYSPSLLAKTSVFSSLFWLDVGTILIAFAVLTVAFVGFFITKLNVVERIILTCVSFLLILYIPFRIPTMLIAGIALFIAMLLQQFINRNRKLYENI